MSDLEWGVSTWHLLHYIAEKISDEFYINNKNEIINMVKTICYNLPCPDCAGHAKYYLNSLNSNLFVNKEEFKKVLYNFHNTVNKSLSKPLFHYSKLKIYKKYNLGIILNNFSLFYGKRYGNSLQLSLQSNQLTRRNIVKQVNLWFKLNMKEFI